MQFLHDFIIWLSANPQFIVFTTYLLFVNFLALLMMWWDKRSAQKNKWRKSEASLILVGAIGGAIGLFIGMFRFRHKTRKRAFQALSAASLVTSLILYWILIQGLLMRM